MTETLKDTDLMTLISIAQKDESKTIEIKKKLLKYEKRIMIFTNN